VLTLFIIRKSPGLEEVKPLPWAVHRHPTGTMLTSAARGKLRRASRPASVLRNGCGAPGAAESTSLAERRVSRKEKKEKRGGKEAVKQTSSSAGSGTDGKVASDE